MHCDHLNTPMQISDNEDLHRSAIGWKLDSQAIRAQLSNCTWAHKPPTLGSVLIPLVRNRRLPNISSEIPDISSEILNIPSKIPNFSSEIPDERWYHHLGWSLDLSRFPIHQQSTVVEDALHQNKNSFVSTSSRNQLMVPSNLDLVSPFVCRAKFEDENLFVKYRVSRNKRTFRMLLEPQCTGSITSSRHPLCLEINFLVVSY